MNKCFFIVICILFSAQFNLIYSQDTLKISGNPLLSNGDFYCNPEITSINGLRYWFDGYLAVEIDKNIKYKDTTFFYCKVFFVKDLKDLNDSSSHFFYSPLLTFYLTHRFFSVKNDSLGNFIDNFLSSYSIFNDANSPDYVSFLYSPKDKFRIKSFMENNFYENANYYYCFSRLTFLASEFEMVIRLVNEGKISIHTVKILLPLSKLKEPYIEKDENFNDLNLKKVNLKIISNRN
jgi:hypothetical protein